MTAHPIVIKGYKFFNSVTGENVIIKGIDYYPRPNSGPLDHNSIDLFTSKYRHIWERDIDNFLELGINAVRLYSVDPTQDHSEFMCALNAANIYVMVELASEYCSILASEAPSCYPHELKVRGQAIIKEFSRYTNTLAFSAGNEVNFYVPKGQGPELNAPCVKKFIKDMRTYVSKCPTMRRIPIGVISADTDRDRNALYYNCQSDPENDLDRAEWYGINSYVVCNGTVKTYDEAIGFRSLLNSFKRLHYSIPILVTEYGCLSQTFPTIDGYEGQRTFLDSEWLGLPQVRDVFSGGLAFEYSTEAKYAPNPFPYRTFSNRTYGIGYMSPEDCDDVNIPCSYERTPSFYNLRSAYNKLWIDSEVRLDTFHIGPDRRGPSVCPAYFPQLSSMVWVSDRIPDLKCPPSHLVDVCNVVQVESQLVHFVKVSSWSLVICLSLLFWFKRTLASGKQVWEIIGIDKVGRQSIDLKDGESETLVSSSVSSGKTSSYESMSSNDTA